LFKLFGFSYGQNVENTKKKNLSIGSRQLMHIKGHHNKIRYRHRSRSIDRS